MTDESPIRIAVVGSGPAGFYAAGHLLKDPDARLRGRHVRAPAHAMGPGPLRRRPRPSEDQVGHAASMRRPPRTRASATSATSHFGEHVSREELLAPLPRDRLRDRLAVGPAAGHPRRRPPRLARRDRVRRLVQRPPRPHRPRGRPALGRAGGGDRQRQRRARRRAHARAGPRRAGAHRHRRPRPRGARRAAASARSWSSAAAAPRRRPSPTPSCSSSASSPTPT